MIWTLDLRVPPAMLGYDYSGINPIVQLGPLFHASPGRFNPDPVSLLDAVFPGRFGMEFHKGVGPDLPEPGDLPVRGMEKGSVPESRVQDVGVLFGPLRGGDRAFRYLRILWQGIAPPALKNGGV